MSLPWQHFGNFENRLHFRGRSPLPQLRTTTTTDLSPTLSSLRCFTFSIGTTFESSFWLLLLRIARLSVFVHEDDLAGIDEVLVHHRVFLLLGLLLRLSFVLFFLASFGLLCRLDCGFGWIFRLLLLLGRFLGSWHQVSLLLLLVRLVNRWQHLLLLLLCGLLLLLEHSRRNVRQLLLLLLWLKRLVFHTDSVLMVQVLVLLLLLLCVLEQLSLLLLQIQQVVRRYFIVLLLLVVVVLLGLLGG